MIARLASVALGALLVTGLAMGDAQAEQRKKFRRANANIHFYAGPDMVRVPRAMRYVFGGYNMSAEEFDSIYGDDEDFEPEAFDESYYDPTLDDPAPQPKAKPAVKKTAAKPVAKPAAPASTVSESVDEEINTASIAAPETPPPAKAASTGPLSCDKAGQIISGYGFTGVQAESCKGQTYAFAAMRDGTPFAIKLNSANGELTEVKKLQ